MASLEFFRCILRKIRQKILADNRLSFGGELCGTNCVHCGHNAPVHCIHLIHSKNRSTLEGYDVGVRHICLHRAMSQETIGYLL